MTDILVDMKMISKMGELVKKMDSLSDVMSSFSAEMDLSTTNSLLTNLQAIISDIANIETEITDGTTASEANQALLTTIDSVLDTIDSVLDTISSTLTTISGNIIIISTDISSLLAEVEGTYDYIAYNKDSSATTGSVDLSGYVSEPCIILSACVTLVDLTAATLIVEDQTYPGYFGIHALSAPITSYDGGWEIGATKCCVGDNINLVIPDSTHKLKVYFSRSAATTKKMYITISYKRISSSVTAHQYCDE